MPLHYSRQKRVSLVREDSGVSRKILIPPMTNRRGTVRQKHYISIGGWTQRRSTRECDATPATECLTAAVSRPRLETHGGHTRRGSGIERVSAEAKKIKN